MNPDDNLREQLRLAQKILKDAQKDWTGVYMDLENSKRLAELVLEMDSHLIHGGTLPNRYWVENET